MDQNGFDTWDKIAENAQKYDLLEINRGPYSHWAMYLGNGDIVHVTQVEERTMGNQAEKRTDKLHLIARESKCRINNQEDAAASKGLKVQKDEDILKSFAEVIDGHDYRVVPYTVYHKNCEYYATRWKYGKGFSTQIEELVIKHVPPEMLAASVTRLN